MEDPTPDFFAATARLHGHTPASHFSLTLCITTMVLLGAALAAALLGVQWGADIPPGDALPLAWLYVNLALAAAVFLVWPALTLRGEPATRRQHLWDLAAVGIAAIPALGVAAWLAQVDLTHAVGTLALQSAFALLALAVLTQRRLPATGRAVVLITLMLFLPLLAYIQREFAPATPSAWHAFLPPLALTRIDTLGSTLWWIVAAYAFPALALLLLPPPPEAP